MNKPKHRTPGQDIQRGSLRIVFVIHSMTPGGAERATANMANYWCSAGHRVTVVSLDSGAGEFYPLDRRIKRIALNVAGDSGGGLRAVVSNLRRVLAIRRCLRRAQADVVIGMMSTSAVLCSLASAGMRCVTLGAERTWPARAPDNRFWEWLRRYAYGRLDAVIAQTESASQWLRENTQAKRVLTIPNPLICPVSSPPPWGDPDRVIDPSRRMLIAVGRPEPVKGFEHLLAAFALVASKHPDWDLVILGEGSLRKPLLADAERRGLQDRIHLPGHFGNVGQWYQRADLFALSSLTEGFPNALLEAMAHGCAVVTSRCQAGPAEIVRERIDGLLVPTADPQAMAAALDELMGDDALRAAFAQRATEVHQRYASGAIIGRWEALFEPAARTPNAC